MVSVASPWWVSGEVGGVLDVDCAGMDDMISLEEGVRRAKDSNASSTFYSRRYKETKRGE